MGITGDVLTAYGDETETEQGEDLLGDPLPWKESLSTGGPLFYSNVLRYQAIALQVRPEIRSRCAVYLGVIDPFSAVSHHAPATQDLCTQASSLELPYHTRGQASFSRGIIPPKTSPTHSSGSTLFKEQLHVSSRSSIMTACHLSGVHLTSCPGQTFACL